MYTSQFVYTFIHQWTLELLPHFDYWEYCCYENGCTNISCDFMVVQISAFNSLGYIPRIEIPGSHEEYIYIFFFKFERESPFA